MRVDCDPHDNLPGRQALCILTRLHQLVQLGHFVLDVRTKLSTMLQRRIAMLLVANGANAHACNHLRCTLAVLTCLTPAEDTSSSTGS